jgi:hypothetical protein
MKHVAEEVKLLLQNKSLVTLVLVTLVRVTVVLVTLVTVTVVTEAVEEAVVALSPQRRSGHPWS